MRNKSIRLLLIAQATALLFACTPGTDTDSGPHPGIVWVRDAAEFDAIAMQVYRAASDDLPGLVADKSWTAMPGQESYGELPPAVILDVDETLVSNVAFQELLTSPFKNSMLHDWNSNNKATAIPGAVEFVKLAREHGVELFFVTNRPCRRKPHISGRCPQEAITVQDLVEAGIPADSDHVMMANESPASGKKSISHARRPRRRPVVRARQNFSNDIGGPDGMYCRIRCMAPGRHSNKGIAAKAAPTVCFRKTHPVGGPSGPINRG